MRLPGKGTTGYTLIGVFAAVLASRLAMVVLMAPYVADVVWTLLMALGALGYACTAAFAATLIDFTSRRLGATLMFGVRVFGGLFLLGAYLITMLIDVVFAFLPHVLMITAPFLLASAIVGIVLGILVASAVQLADTFLRRLRTEGA